MDTYKTYDLLIAAVLTYNDYECDIIKDVTGLRCSFIFQRDYKLPDIKKLVDDYWKGNLLVEPKKFNNLVRTLKARTKDIN
jgi:hypothetical protein